MSAFTPGPWRVNGDGASSGPDGAFSVIGGCGCCGSPWVNGDGGAQQANANLIAAAPDLHAALAAIVARKSHPTRSINTPSKWRMVSVLSEEWDAAVAALAKANT